ncbi:hypothetical protein LLB_0036 [Legionella longbeachae D-4968]|nr:hypothetical protein LLB_0036 [Legionella longbeachae D-4968]
MHNKFEEKWIKYCLNDVECDRETIYQMIQNKNLYAYLYVVTNF